MLRGIIVPVCAALGPSHWRSGPPLFRLRRLPPLLPGPWLPGRWLLAMSLLVSAGGCGRSADEGGQPGVVRYETRELTNVQVTYHRVTAGGFEKVAIGLTQGDGKFRLRAPDGTPTNLPAGQYRVTLEHVGDTTWSFANNLAKPETSSLDVSHGESTGELIVELPPNSVLLIR